jgi:hypothetical protein
LFSIAFGPAWCFALGSKDVMRFKLRKRKWLALALLLALPLMALWSLPPRRPPVRVTFQQTTNDPGNGRVGVIEVANNLNETVIIMGAWYVPAKREDLSMAMDTPCASIFDNVSKCAARSTNIVRVSIPTTGGPYRLALQCMPDSKDPWRNQGTLRYRIADLVFLRLQLSQRTMVRWYGGSIVPSQSIEFNQ